MPHLTVTVLGSGTSQGVPMIGCRCDVCLSPDPRDNRTRSSIFLQTPEVRLLVDTGPELRMQALREGLDHVDAVLYTHAHADHLMGFDDLRRFCEMQQAALPIYGSEPTLAQIERTYPYAFNPQKKVFGYVHVTPHIVTETFRQGELDITPLPVPHGAVSTYGYLFAHQGRKLLAYLSDCAEVPAPIRDLVAGVDVLIIDGLRDKPHPTHLNVAGAVEASLAIGARASYLTHQTHDKSHAVRSAELPPGIGITFDGMKLEFELS